MRGPQKHFFSPPGEVLFNLGDYQRESYRGQLFVEFTLTCHDAKWRGGKKKGGEGSIRMSNQSILQLIPPSSFILNAKFLILKAVRARGHL